MSQTKGNLYHSGAFYAQKEVRYLQPVVCFLLTSQTFECCMKSSPRVHQSAVLIKASSFHLAICATDCFYSLCIIEESGLITYLNAWAVIGDGRTGLDVTWLSRGERFEAVAGAERRRVGGAEQRSAESLFISYGGPLPARTLPWPACDTALEGGGHMEAHIYIGLLLQCSVYVTHVHLTPHSNNLHSHRRWCFHCSYCAFRLNLTSACTSGDQPLLELEQHCPCLDLMYHWRQTHTTVTKTVHGALMACELIIKHQWCNTDTEWKYSIIHVSCCLWCKR